MYKRKRSVYDDSGDASGALPYAGRRVVKRRKKSNVPSKKQLMKIYPNMSFRGFIGKEKKYFDAIKAFTNVTSIDWSSALLDPATVDCINAIAQGTSQNQRIGKKYTITDVVLNLHIKLLPGVQVASAGAIETYTLKWALVLDKQTNGAQLNAQNVYKDNVGITDVISHRNLENATRFQVLCSGIETMNHTTVFTNGTNAYYSREDKIQVCYKKVNIEVNCKGTGANVTDISDNSLHLIACSNAANKYAIEYVCRVRFKG